MTDSPPKLLVVLPTAWDQKQFESCRAEWQGRFEIEYAEPSDADCPSDFDPFGYIHTTAERSDFAGVFSSSDYPGATVAAAIAHARGLVGPDPKLILEASHKLTSRQKQLACVPDATPGFCLVDPDKLEEPTTGFPCFVKPIKGAFSMFAKRVNSMEELRAHLDRPEVDAFRHDFLEIFNNLWDSFAGEYARIDGSFFIAEELLTGQQVTVEGYIVDDEPVFIGVVDSEFHEGTRSFSRFVYPSALPPEVQEEMGDVAARCVKGMGLRRCFFNIEMTWDGERIGIIEVNPRICGQFGDLYAKVDGRNCYAVVPKLKCGQPSAWPRRKGQFKIAASVPLRVFEPCTCTGAPDAARVKEVEAKYPGTLIWNEVEPGTELRDFAHEDGASFRYAVINLGANSREELLSKADEITAALGYSFKR